MEKKSPEAVEAGAVTSFEWNWRDGVGSLTAKAIRAWGAWWANASIARRFLPGVLVVAYWITIHQLHAFRSDHAVLGSALLILYYGGPVTDGLRRFLLPLILTGMIYDSQRFYSDYIRGPIHVQEPYLFDKYFFGISTPEGVLTPNEWWQKHTHPVLDLLTGFIYLVFFSVFTLFAAYFHFYLPRKGTTKCSPQELKQKTMAVMWAFFWLNIIGYSTYYWYAAAPPWYVALKGLGPADLSTPPNPAGCSRFDQLLGVSVFAGMYGRSADVFGAIPSLHIAYPFLAVLFSFLYGAAQVPALIFYAWMCFSAVYLNHHYILDILWGTAYALMTGLIVHRYYQKRVVLPVASCSGSGRAPSSGDGPGSKDGRYRQACEGEPLTAGSPVRSHSSGPSAEI